MTAFWHYAQAVFGHWYAAVTGVLLVADGLLKWTLPSAKAWLDRKWPPENRRPLEVLALVFAFGYSSFEVFQEQGDALTAQTSRADRADQSAAYWKGRAENVASGAPAAKIVTPPINYSEIKALVNYIKAGKIMIDKFQRLNSTDAIADDADYWAKRIGEYLKKADNLSYQLFVSAESINPTEAQAPGVPYAGGIITRRIAAQIAVLNGRLKELERRE